MMMMRPQLDYYDMGDDVVAFSSTRQGGCSQGHYAGFNINCYCGDSEDAIRHNRELLCRLLSISDDHLLMPHQVHQSKIACVDEALLKLTEEECCQQLDGYDALMTNIADICIGVSTADCIPILLYDPVHHAVCAVHAGWRGTVARIVEASVSAMREAFASNPADLRAQIGPGISLESFEVGDEVYDAFRAAGFDMPTISRRDKKWHINLPECNRQQLIASGICEDAIRQSGICTYQHSDRYFSARRLGVCSGRIFSGIMLRSTSKE